MKYTLKTWVEFKVPLDGFEDVAKVTLEDLGFTREQLEKRTNEDIERHLKNTFPDLEVTILKENEVMG